MNTQDVLSELMHELRTLVWPGEALETTPMVTRRISLNGDSLVTAFALNSETVDEAIFAEIAHYRRRLDKEFEWKVFSFDSPLDLLERLRRAGFSVGDREAVVIYDLDNGLTPLVAEDACEVRRIDREDQLADFRAVAESVFKKDYAFTTNQLASAMRTGQTGHDGYVAYVDGHPVSVGRLYTNPNSKFAGLYGGGTLEEYRGQGCYRAVVAARARDAVAAGARYLLVDALPTSLPILLRLGFVHLADTWPCTLVEP